MINGPGEARSFGRREASQAVLLRPHPGALKRRIAGSCRGRIADPADDDRAVEVRGLRRSHQATGPREQGLLAAHPLCALGEAGRGLLVAHHDVAVSRNAVGATGPSGHGAPEVHHAGRVFPPEGVREIAPIPPEADHDVSIAARVARAAERRATA